MSVGAKVSVWRAVAAGLAGASFGVGLAVAGMTDPVKVLNFLDITGAWDPSLMLVLGGAVVLTFVGYRWILKRQQPVLAEVFSLPKRRDIDRQLVMGAVFFGLGWGIAGYCPGPALAALGMGNTEAYWFVPAMLVGMFSRRWIERVQLRRADVKSATQATAKPTQSPATAAV